MENLLNDAFEEAGNRNKLEEGGYDLWKIEAFVAGVNVVKKLSDEGKSPLVDIDEMIEGYKWAVNQVPDLA